MTIQKNYATVSEAINDLTKRGYADELNIDAESACIVCPKITVGLPADEFNIDEVYRFEGSSDPGDEAVIFAISSFDHYIKGILVDAFGTYADGDTRKVLQGLHRRTLYSQ